MNTLEKAAREYAGIKPDVFIDSEERYYNGHACENYDTFKAGAEWMQEKMIEKACEWLMHNVNRYINDEGAGYFRIEKTLFDHFRQAMEE